MEKSEITKNDLIEVVKKIMSGKGTEEEISDLIDLFEDNVQHPAPSDLIFNDQKELTPKDIVEEALSYRKICI